MAKDAANGWGRTVPWRLLGWSTAGLLLLLPWISRAPWSPGDYLFAAMLFASVGLAFEVIVRKSGSLAYRLGAMLTVAAAGLTIVINCAVGMIGSEDNPYNLVFLGVPLIVLGGAVLARFRPAGMMRATAIAATAQLAAGAAGLAADPRGGFMSMVFAGIWLFAAAAFRSAASGAPSAEAR